MISARRNAEHEVVRIRFRVVQVTTGLRDQVVKIQIQIQILNSRLQQDVPRS